MSPGARLRRFLHIERSRPSAPEADAGSATARRIGGLERPGPESGEPSASGADLERFVPPPPPPLELAAPDDGARPFTRCMACGMDHHVAAVECAGCGARLDTEAQRAFSDALWRARREQAACEAAERRDPEAEGDGPSPRALGEALAREVAEAERRRLEAELGRESAWDALRRLVGRLLG